MSTLAMFTNLFGPQGMFILLVVLLLFGAKRLPELGKSLGETIREFNKTKDERDEEERKKLEEKKK